MGYVRVQYRLRARRAVVIVFLTHFVQLVSLSLHSHIPTDELALLPGAGRKREWKDLVDTSEEPL